MEVEFLFDLGLGEVEAAHVELAGSFGPLGADIGQHFELPELRRMGRFAVLAGALLALGMNVFACFCLSASQEGVLAGSFETGDVEVVDVDVGILASEL